jgi:hypothetical protein
MTHSLFASSVTQHPSVVDATTRAIQLALPPVTAEGADDLRETMRQLCSEARRLSLRPEELIILFKTRWAAHSEFRALPRDQANAALDHIITMCINEYYRDGLGH